MKKSTLNLYINALMFLCMSAIAGIGFLIKYTLITGRESQIIYGNNIQLSFLGMGRHEWGTIHLIISFLFLGLLALHLYLHWKTIICVFNKLVPQNVPNKIVLFSFIMISSLLMIVPFLINPKIDGINNRNEQHRTINRGQGKKDKINAQNRVQNKQQRICKTQQFIDVDTNGCGFIGQDEYQIDTFNEFDTNQDGKLSRIEYQKKNRRTKRNSTGNFTAGMNRGNGNCQVTQCGNGNGQRTNQCNGKKNGTGNFAAGMNRGNGNCQVTQCGNGNGQRINQCNGKKNGTGNFASGMNRGNGNCQVTQQDNGKKQRINQGNDNQCARKKNNINTRRRRS